MGKPFKTEIEKLSITSQWAAGLKIERLTEFLLDNSDLPLYVVGSGGSLSACYLASLLYQKSGNISKPTTPLELLYSKMALRKSKILFISSSGKNQDILFAFKVAISQEPDKILTFCMRPLSALSRLVKQYSISESIDCDIPSKKDGFLATNTLLAYYILICKSFGYEIDFASEDINNQLNEIRDFATHISPKHTITVLYGGWGHPVAIDIESKFSEAALCNVNITDYRNFGHGRHYWFAKRPENSAIILLITPEENSIAHKTISLLPKNTPVLSLESKRNSPISSIELLIKSFHLINEFSKNNNIDPGRPHVPDFGRKLYNLKFSSFYKEKSFFKENEKHLYIIRKVKITSILELDQKELKFWESRFESFYKHLRNTPFGIVIFDYDGTLCSADDRYKGLALGIKSELLRLLDNKITIGIATGRGKSVKKELQSFIPYSLQSNVIIGYYNGTMIGSLDDENIPDTNISTDILLKKFENEASYLKRIFPSLQLDLRPLQLTISSISKSNFKRIISQIKVLMLRKEFNSLEILESSHSIDIVIKDQASKLNIISKCVYNAKINNKSNNYLCIGDKGEWPGNDYELLSTKYSLSVDEVSSNPDTCWNIASLGVKNSDATYEYLRRLLLKRDNLIFV